MSIRGKRLTQHKQSGHSGHVFRSRVESLLRRKVMRTEKEFEAAVRLRQNALESHRSNPSLESKKMLRIATALLENAKTHSGEAMRHQINVSRQFRK